MPEASKDSIDAAESLLRLAQRRIAEGETAQGAQLLACLISSFPNTQAAKSASQMLRSVVPKDAASRP